MEDNIMINFRETGLENSGWNATKVQWKTFILSVLYTLTNFFIIIIIIIIIFISVGIVFTLS